MRGETFRQTRALPAKAAKQTADKGTAKLYKADTWDKHGGHMHGGQARGRGQSMYGTNAGQGLEGRKNKCHGK